MLNFPPITGSFSTQALTPRHKHHLSAVLPLSYITSSRPDKSKGLQARVI